MIPHLSCLWGGPVLFLLLKKVFQKVMRPPAGVASTSLLYQTQLSVLFSQVMLHLCLHQRSHALLQRAEEVREQVLLAGEQALHPITLTRCIEASWAILID